MAQLDSFRTARWLRTLNLVLQAVLLLTFVAGLNYVASNPTHAWRFDLTRSRRFSLSPETLSWVKKLPQPVTVVVTFTQENDNREVRGLLGEFRHLTEGLPNGKIDVRYLDPFQNRLEAEKLGVEQAGMVVLLCGERRSTVAISELYQMKNGERTAFIGEQVLTSKLLDVSNPERPHVYFLVGHAELRPDDVDPMRGLSLLREGLANRNFKIDTLELAVSRGIPKDASLLIAVAPQSRYTREEQDILRQYLGSGAGRLILFLGFGASVASLGLDDLLLDWGVLADDDVICDTGAENFTDDGDLVIRFLDEKHPITQNLINYRVNLRAGLTRSVRPDPGRPLGSALNVVTLAATSTTAWGERDYRASTARYNAGYDIRPIPGMEPKDRLGVAVASERVDVGSNLKLSVKGGRLVVVGTGDLVANARLASAGNQFFILGAVNWCVEREHLFNVLPRPLERFQLSLSAGELLQLRYALLFALPGAAAILGLIVYWTRRT